VRNLNYFEENEERMHYDQYRAMHLPIGSGTVESSCKKVIGGRMKQGGMTWSESGAEGMLQIRTSLCSERFQNDFRQTLRFVARFPVYLLLESAPGGGQYPTASRGDSTSSSFRFWVRLRGWLAYLRS